MPDLRFGETERFAESGSGFAAETGNTHAVRSVGGDLELDARIIKTQNTADITARLS